MPVIVFNYHITVCSLIYCKQRIGVIWLHWWQNYCLIWANGMTPWWKRAGMLQKLRMGHGALARGRLCPNVRYLKSNEQSAYSLRLPPLSWYIYGYIYPLIDTSCIYKILLWYVYKSLKTLICLQKVNMTNLALARCTYHISRCVLKLHLMKHSQSTTSKQKLSYFSILNREN